MKGLVNDLTATFHDIADTPEIAPINLNDGINYLLLAVVL